jgi:hypothetical protein
MECPKCHVMNPDGKKFCRECGAKLTFLCPQCAAELSPGDNFCGECVQFLQLPSTPTPKGLSIDEKISEIQRYLPQGLTDKILSPRDLPVWRSGRRRRHATASPPDERKRANWCPERSPAPSLVRHFPGFLPGSTGHPWLESLAFERRFAKPEGFGTLALAKDLSKALLHHGPDGRPLSGGHVTRFLQQRIRYLYGRLHTSIFIRLYVKMSSAD